MGERLPSEERIVSKHILEHLVTPPTPHPYILHPCTLHPYTLHPCTLHPYTFHSCTIHPCTIHLCTLHPSSCHIAKTTPVHISIIRLQHPRFPVSVLYKFKITITAVEGWGEVLRGDYCTGIEHRSASSHSFTYLTIAAEKYSG